MDEDRIHLRLVTPSETPVQIMEADEEDDVPDIQVVNVHSLAYVNDQEHKDLMILSRDRSQQVGSLNGQEQTSNGTTIFETKKYVMSDGVMGTLKEVAADTVPQVDDITDIVNPEAEVINPDELSVDIGDRLTTLENEMQRTKSRQDGFSQELKILIVEIKILSDWFTDHFGIELIDRTSKLFKHIHDFEEVEDMLQTLSLLKKGNSGVRRSARRKLIKPKRSVVPPLSKRKRGRGRPKRKQNSESEESELDADERVEPAETEEFFEPPECLLNTDVDEEFFKEDKPKRKRVRKRPPKKVLPGKDEVEAEPEPEIVVTEAETEVKEESKEDDANQDGRKKKKWKSQPRSLQCEECGKILKADSSLRWHMLMHADLRPVECTEPGCGKSFRDKSKLAQHYKIHGSEKNEKCRYCDRGFLRKKDLVVHERTHTGEKPYACTHPDCGKTFNIKDHLTIHLRVHTGERPYKCETCQKSFSQANSLRIHKKIHLKQASDYVPAPRKPRAPRKNKVVLPVPEAPPSPNSSSLVVIDINEERAAELEEAKSISVQESRSDGVSDAPSPVTAVDQHSSLVQTFFQAQTLNLVDPVQQAWNFVTAPNSVATEHQQHHHQQHQHHQTHQRQFQAQSLGSLSVGHLSVVQGHGGGGTTFKLQPISYHPQPQQQQQHSTQQHAQNISIIRNPLSGQSGPFVPAQFHDPSTFQRHFQN